MTTFDSTVIGQPCTRIQRVVIDYPAEATAEVTVTHQLHVPLTDGTFQPIGGLNETRFSLNPGDMGAAVELYTPGPDMPLGASTTTGNLMVGIYSVIRSKMV